MFPIAPVLNYPRNARRRSPISSLLLNDIFDETYWEVARLLGYSGTSLSMRGGIDLLSSQLADIQDSEHRIALEGPSTYIPLLGASGPDAGTIVTAESTVSGVDSSLSLLYATFRRA